MNIQRVLIGLLLIAAMIAATPGRRFDAVEEKDLLYVASPGIRNYVEFGGVGILVFDIKQNHKFVKRIPTWDYPAGAPAENITGTRAPCC